MSKIFTYYDFLKINSDNHFIPDNTVIPAIAKNLALDQIHNLAPYFTFVTDYRIARHSYLSPNMEYVIKHPLKKMYEGGLEYWIAQIHKRDFEIYNERIFKELYRFYIQNQNKDLSNYRISFNHKAKKYDGTYMHLQQQYFVLERDAKGLPLSIYGTISNISHLMLNNNKIHLSISQLDNGNSTELIHCDYFSGSEILSCRELLVLQLIVKGNTTKEIAERLFISEETVRTHRSHMLEKANVKNMPQLVHVAHLQGWL